MFSSRTNSKSATIVVYMFLSAVSTFAGVDKTQSGQADMVFDKVFLQSIRNVRQYERIVKIVGVPPVKIGAASVKIPGEKYHWNGRVNTSFNIRVFSGKIIDANVVAPDGRFISLESDGELFEFGK